MTALTRKLGPLKIVFYKIVRMVSITILIAMCDHLLEI